MLGDENNNDLVNLDAVDRAKCALVVIDELGDPTGTPLEPVLLPAMILSRGLGYYSQLLISAFFTVIAQIYYSRKGQKEV